MKTLEQACTPRQSVFDQRGKDTVYNIDDLRRIPPKEFFSENYITDGMRLLLEEAFKRLEGKSNSTAGTFLLSQSMGGGKTHNLIALGLLAEHPELREAVMAGFYKPGPLGAVRVVTINGRKNAQFGIWGEIADQLNKKEAFSRYYSPLLPPGDEDWVSVLRGEPVLILLDELPPYFQAARAQSIGNSDLADVTTRALANLLVAVNSGKLNNVCVVFTDLSDTAYSQGSSALADLKKEVARYHAGIEPVKMNSDELYHILRTRLFEKLPEAGEISEIAEAYRRELENAKLMQFTEASPEQLKADLQTAYPFHPAIRDLYARFRENEGFQQTRALIRMMRIAVAELWTSDKAKRQYLVAAHDFDLHDAEMLSEVRQINNSLGNAIAKDIADEGGKSTAEQIDGAGASDAQDAARLIFLSSLSTAVNPVLGLHRTEIAAYLAAPGRDLNALRSGLDSLQGTAWYLHATRDGKLLFKNTENLLAKVDSYTKGQPREVREGELRTRLKDLFKTVKSDCYQEVLALPPLDEVQLTQDKVTLVLFQPSDRSIDEIKDFHEHQVFKNRVLFVTGHASGYETALHRAAELNAVLKILKELQSPGSTAGDLQIAEAEHLLATKQSNFYMALRETFQTIYYPTKQGLTPLEFTPRYEANKYEAESQITQELSDDSIAKFVTDTSADSTFRKTLERVLWPSGQDEVSWAQIKRQAAQDGSWRLHHPKALDTLKDEMLRRDIWRQTSPGYVHRGPFPKPATSVEVKRQSRDDVTGGVILRVRPTNGADTVYWSSTGLATIDSPKLDAALDLPTKSLRLSFMGIDSTGQAETGDPVPWENEVSIQHRFYVVGDDLKCELRALPSGAIRYTTDGSNPEAGGVAYAGEFVVPPASKFVLAFAEAEGIKSEQGRWEVPEKGKGGSKVIIDPVKPASWKRKHSWDSTKDVYEKLALVAQHRGEVADAELGVMREKRFLELSISAEVWLTPQQLIEQADRMKELIPDGNASLVVRLLRFPSGQDLSNAIADFKLPGEVGPDEVKQ
jgi:hypothetical protein